MFHQGAALTSDSAFYRITSVFVSFSSLKCVRVAPLIHKLSQL